MTADAVAWERMLASMRMAFGSMPKTSEGGSTLRLDGVVAAVTPAVPERSLPNSVTYETEEALADALDELAEAYEEAGVQAWTVWVPEHHRRAADLLERAGHRLDANPTAMIAELSEIEPPREGDPEPAPRPVREDLGRVNDLAYGTTDSFQRLIGEGPADPAHTYVAQSDGEATACVASMDLDGDCSIWWVATVPQARGRGLAAGLMRQALADGRDRGCDVSTLQATKLGRPVYERLGYRAFGEIQMWERRPSG
ncbi:MAG TPA: GNAT family N-acetyltransferase [Thermoleophilaceae bacterium]